MLSPEPSYTTTAGPEYQNRAEAQEEYFKAYFMKMIEVHKQAANEIP